MINTIASGIQSDSLAGAVMCVSSCMLFTPSLYALLADLRLVRVYQAPTALTVGSTKCCNTRRQVNTIQKNWC
jgi:hypothetical protein